MKKVLGTIGSSLLLLAAAAVFAAPAHAQTGAALFKAKCAPCHGPDGKGETSMGKVLKVRDLSSPEVQKQSDAELTGLIENGKGKMPAYKAKLSERDIKELVSYIRTLKK
jgi:cytochrome c6